MTLVEAAEQAGIGRDTLSDLERGRRHPVTPTLSRIAKGYGVPVEELLEEPIPLASAPSASPSPDGGADEAGQRNEEVSGEERSQKLQDVRELLADTHALLEELAETYKAAGDTGRLETLASVAMFSVMGADQFVKAEVGPAEDSASVRVYATGARLDALVGDLLEAVQSTATGGAAVGKVASLDAYRRRRAG